MTDFYVASALIFDNLAVCVVIIQFIIADVMFPFVIAQAFLRPLLFGVTFIITDEPCDFFDCQHLITYLLINPTVLLDILLQTVSHSIHQVVEIVNRFVQFIAELISCPGIV